MFGSGNPTPYDILLICLLAALAMVTFAALLVGIAATAWLFWRARAAVETPNELEAASLSAPLAGPAVAGR